MVIPPSPKFKLIVNDLTLHEGIGVLAPKNLAVATAGLPFTFKWDTKGKFVLRLILSNFSCRSFFHRFSLAFFSILEYKGIIHYAGNTEISAQIPIETVDIKVTELKLDFPERFLFLTVLISFLALLVFLLF